MGRCRMHPFVSGCRRWRVHPSFDGSIIIIIIIINKDVVLLHSSSFDRKCSLPPDLRKRRNVSLPALQMTKQIPYSKFKRGLVQVRTKPNHMTVNESTWFANFSIANLFSLECWKGHRRRQLWNFVLRRRRSLFGRSTLTCSLNSPPCYHMERVFCCCCCYCVHDWLRTIVLIVLYTLFFHIYIWGEREKNRQFE